MPDASVNQSFVNVKTRLWNSWGVCQMGLGKVYIIYIFREMEFYFFQCNGQILLIAISKMR